MILRVFVFYALTFLITVVLGGLQQGVESLSEALILPQLGPGVAALLMLVIFRKDALAVTFGIKKTPLSRYAAAIVLPVAGALVTHLLYSLVLSSPKPLGEPPSWGLLLWMPAGAIGEEIGWRGYLHKSLDRGVSGLGSSTVVGVLWALWHVGMYQNGAVYMLFFALLMVSYSVVFFALVRDIDFGVGVAALFHVMINVTYFFSYSVIGDVSFIIVSSLVWATVAASLVMRRRRWFMTAAASST